MRLEKYFSKFRNDILKILNFESLKKGKKTLNLLVKLIKSIKFV
jgi:hypothetical protein